MKKEKWKAIPYFDGFQVSNEGRVRNRHGRILKGSVNNNGYQMVHLRTKDKNKLCTVHRLVAQAFISNPDELPQVNHKDENKLNNRVENLEWCTSSYNMNYGTRNKRITKIKRNNTYNTKAVRCVELKKTYPSTREAERQTGIRNDHIIQVCNHTKHYKTAGGFHWKYVERSDEQ